MALTSRLSAMSKSDRLGHPAGHSAGHPAGPDPANWSWASVRCSTGKRGYYSYKGARKAASRQRRNGDKKISAYSCPECYFFHLGHLRVPWSRTRPKGAGPKGSGRGGRGD